MYGRLTLCNYFLRGGVRYFTLSYCRGHTAAGHISACSIFPPAVIFPCAETGATKLAEATIPSVNTNANAALPRLSQFYYSYSLVVLMEVFYIKISLD